MDSHNLSDEYVNAAATEAVENRLRIRDFIERHSEQILDELEKSAAKTRGKDESLRVIDSVIHLGSGRNDYMNALQWAKGKQPARDPDRWLTLLTFIYIVRKGLSERSKDFAKIGIWNTIMSRVEALLREDAPRREEKESKASVPSSGSGGEGFGMSARAENSG